jgi:endonuclease/exonuclease/phosphatase family metal-dependent hydrolase
MATPCDLAVASCNIQKGVGTDRRRDPARTAKVIAETGADIQALHVADTRFGTLTGLLDLDGIRRDLALIAGPPDAVGAAHAWPGNLFLVRDAQVQVVHELILPGQEPRWPSDGLGDFGTAVAIGESPSGVFIRAPRRTGAGVDRQDHTAVEGGRHC